MTSIDLANVPLPTAASGADDWQLDDAQPYRVIFGTRPSIDGRPDVILFPTAVQLPDGSIDNGSRIEPPVVYIDVTTDRGLTAAQARALGAALGDAAALLDRWEQFTGD
jgi:hypothetical protein